MKVSNSKFAFKTSNEESLGKIFLLVEFCILEISDVKLARGI